MIIQGRKEQKQVVIEDKAKIYTEVRYFAMKSGRNCYKQRNQMRGL